MILKFSPWLGHLICATIILGTNDVAGEMKLSPGDELVIAAAKGDIKEVEGLLDKGVDPNSVAVYQIHDDTDLDSEMDVTEDDIPEESTLETYANTTALIQ